MRGLVLASTVSLVLFVGACGQDEATTATEPSASASSAGSPDSDAAAGTEEEADRTAGTKAGTKGGTKGGKTGAAGAQTPELLDFSATTVDGASFDGATLAGRPTVLWFWAPWCPTCRGQIPQVQALAADRGGDINVIGVGALDSAEAIAEFAGDVTGVTHLEDVDGELWKRFGVTEQSSFVVLDADGTVSFEAGYGGSDDLVAQVESLLG